MQAGSFWTAAGCDVTDTAADPGMARRSGRWRASKPEPERRRPTSAICSRRLLGALVGSGGPVLQLYAASPRRPN